MEGDAVPIEQADQLAKTLAFLVLAAAFAPCRLHYKLRVRHPTFGCLQFNANHIRHRPNACVPTGWVHDQNIGQTGTHPTRTPEPRTCWCHLACPVVDRRPERRRTQRHPQVVRHLDLQGLLGSTHWLLLSTAPPSTAATRAAA